jgi:NADH:ubiquinone oxidoreductase subunit 5 (subunit L)/multisubunit Na+/H+ antiporter MnhA subunit
MASAAAIFDTAVFDRTANAFASMMLNIAGLSNETDKRVIDRFFERSAVGVGGFGSRLRAFQTGRIYHYLAAVFAWVLLTALITFIVRIM